MLEIEPGAKVVEGTCDHCGQPMTRVTGFVHRDGCAYAVYYASCYHHAGHEVWIDAVFSPTWDEGTDDHLTFGCRVGRVDGQDEPAASLVPAAGGWGNSRVFGHKLSRDEALAHPMLAEFWALVDHVLVHDGVVADHLYGRDATF
ncbi:hypothetical protein J2W20_002144 [Sinomonas atrocyanea]|uniref:hypothetical protein n=1 Tax=Sinomonas atrocyanea TaxID=37927 RepID=UPI0027890F5A|nr:hypothetical protein [Sinomonas atrocyanea]MDQ0260240.1 hypothetical protein [Sinomonas atrocyanea]